MKKVIIPIAIVLALLSIGGALYFYKVQVYDAKTTKTEKQETNTETQSTSTVKQPTNYVPLEKGAQKTETPLPSGVEAPESWPAAPEF